MDRTRNFCIIAHIDHGKSTLADRLIQRTGGGGRAGVPRPDPRLDGSRARARHHHQEQHRHPAPTREGRREYQLNLIDTPGHVDFSHEVRRSLMSCEGALLLVDASQGVEAQTVANLYLALEYDLELIPVINKIDLPAADVERVRRRRSTPTSASTRSRPSRCSAKNRGGRRRPPRSDRGEAAAGPEGRPGSAAPGAHLRRLLRPLPRRGAAGAGQGGHAFAPGQTHPPDAHRPTRTTRSRRSACFKLKQVPQKELDRRRRSAT